MGERVRLGRRGEGKRSRSAVKSVGGKSDQMRGKVKTGREWMTHLLVKVRAEREKGQRGMGGTKDSGAEPIQEG